MLQPVALTTPRPDLGGALATLAKRCARALGSDRRPRRHVSTNTTPRFCVHHGPRRHLRHPDVLACARERKVAGHGGSVERTQGAGVRSASAAPPWASGVRPRSSTWCGCLLPRVVPSRQTTRLHPMCKTSAEQLHRQREPQRTQKRHVVSGLTQRRGHLSEPSSGAHRLASIGYSPPCSSQHSVRLSTWGAQLPKLLEPRPQQSSVRPARAPLAARAAVTVATTSAKGAGDSRSRTSRSPPTCARSTAPSPTI